LSVVCCEVEVSATSSSLVQRSPTEYGVSLCVIMKPRELGGHSPRWAAEPEKNVIVTKFCINQPFRLYVGTFNDGTLKILAVHSYPLSAITVVSV
jgi:hypothetical protein